MQFIRVSKVIIVNTQLIHTLSYRLNNVSCILSVTPVFQAYIIFDTRTLYVNNNIIVVYSALKRQKKNPIRVHTDRTRSRSSSGTKRTDVLVTKNASKKNQRSAVVCSVRKLGSAATTIYA